MLIKVNNMTEDAIMKRNMQDLIQTKNFAFTLIELMIVITIIGILSVFAIPAYKDYTARTRVMEGLHLASAAKLAIEEEVMLTHELPKNEESIGYITPAATSNVQSIHIADATGIITIMYTSALSGGTLLLVPKIQASGEVRWECSGGTLKREYRPIYCKD